MKKESAAWYIAATHYLTAGFAIPLIIMFIFGFALGIARINVGSLPIQILNDVIYLVALWLGVMYSARFLRKKYIITDAAKVVNLSTAYRAVLLFLFYGLAIVLTLGNPNANLDAVKLTVEVVFAIFTTIVFYIASKKYVTQDTIGAPNIPGMPGGMPQAVPQTFPSAPGATPQGQTPTVPTTEPVAPEESEPPEPPKIGYGS